MRDLLAIVHRARPPQPWVEGDNIPWDEPGFSERMLEAHLDDSHDLASRRAQTVERQVEWIDAQLLESSASAVLDLTCGPGLYTNSLARRGHRCVGVDFSPASIAHARAVAAREGLDANYVEADVRTTAFGEGFGLVLFLWGQLNVFRREQALDLLARARDALAPGGQLLIELLAPEEVERLGRGPASWRTQACGVFSADPHLVLEEHAWDAPSRTATTRYFVIDAAHAGVTRYAMSTLAHALPELSATLTKLGFSEVLELPSLTGSAEPDHVTQSLLARLPA